LIANKEAADKKAVEFEESLKAETARLQEIHKSEIDVLNKQISGL